MNDIEKQVVQFITLVNENHLLRKLKKVMEFHWRYFVLTLENK